MTLHPEDHDMEWNTSEDALKLDKIGGVFKNPM
jgi:hypothetical protein